MRLLTELVTSDKTTKNREDYYGIGFFIVRSWFLQFIQFTRLIINENKEKQEDMRQCIY